ncbi:MAG TPA: hypothetical protein VKZ83_02890 [Phototrophicaceae bacterium]|nr:hypothetical protein [Phototrophicaceae bacterium]
MARRGKKQKAPQLPYEVAAAAARVGHAKYLTEEEKDRIGAGAGRWTVATLFLGIFGLGPLGLLTGFRALRGSRTSGWLAVLGMLLSAVHTLLLLAALVVVAVTT